MLRSILEKKRRFDKRPNEIDGKDCTGNLPSGLKADPRGTDRRAKEHGSAP